MLVNRIKLVRKTLGLTQREFGEKMGVSRDVVGNIEYRRVPPKKLFLQHMCQQYKVNEQWLETGEGEMFDECPKEETKFDKFDRLYSVFKSLKPAYQDCALEQIESLADLQDQTKD